ncbi:MAG: glycosyltransferase, partial [Alphaproteobacteria bacterium]|nr:glycosyltransferase [Alphaproteobacteria bacterium]
FAAMGGPDFCGKPAQPHWLDEAAGLLEIPLTTGFTGALAPLGPGMAPLFDSPQAIAARLPGILGRTGMLSRTRLTPEGVPAAELCKLLDVLVARGQRIFTMAYHSSSLLAGGSPYARTAEDVAAFCATIRQVLTHFRDRLGGRFITLDDIYDGFANPGQNAK